MTSKKAILSHLDYLDQDMFKTSGENVYDIGDMLRPGVVIKAIAEGRVER